MRVFLTVRNGNEKNNNYIKQNDDGYRWITVKGEKTDKMEGRVD